MKRIGLSLAVVATLLVASCGNFGMVQQEQRPEIKAPADKATLVIIRATNFGFAMIIDNYLDGKHIGQTKGKTYFLTEVEPGTHYVMSQAENVGCARFDFEAGKVYYLTQAIFPGIMKARTGFIAIDPEQAEKDIEDCNYYVYDSANPGENMDPEDYQETKADFDDEAINDPDRHKDVLNYPGY